MTILVIRSLFCGSRRFLSNVFSQMSHPGTTDALVMVQPHNKTTPISIITNDPKQDVTKLSALCDHKNHSSRVFMFGHGMSKGMTYLDRTDFPLHLFGTHGYRTEDTSSPLGAFPGLLGTEHKKRSHDYHLCPLEHAVDNDPVIKGLKKFLPPQTADFLKKIIVTASASQKQNKDVLSILQQMKLPQGEQYTVTIDHTALCTQLLMSILIFRATHEKVAITTITQRNNHLIQNPTSVAVCAEYPELLSLALRLKPVTYDLLVPLTNKIIVQGILNILRETYNPKEHGTEVVGLFCRHNENDHILTGEDGFPELSHYAGLKGKQLNKWPFRSRNVDMTLPSKQIINALRIHEPNRRLTPVEIALIVTAINDWGRDEFHHLYGELSGPIFEYLSWLQNYSISYIDMVFDNMYMAITNRVV